MSPADLAMVWHEADRAYLTTKNERNTQAWFASPAHVTEPKIQDVVARRRDKKFVPLSLKDDAKRIALFNAIVEVFRE